MIYRVVLDDTIDIHTSDINCMLLNPSIELEMNSAGSFTFTLPPTHPNWDDFKVLKSTIDVYENNELIFTGRVASIEKNWNNERVVKCEGALAYFNDSIHRQMKWENPLPIASEDPTVHNFLKDILDNHNVFEGSENLNRHIYIGHIYIDTELVTREVDYDTTLDILTRMCIDTNGGYFQIRKDPEDGKLYLDWLKDFTDESSQPASFGLNLLDFNTSLSAEDICTGVLARGATVNDQVVTLTDVELVDETTYPDYSVTHYTDHDQDILWHRDGVATFGQVVLVKDFSDAQVAWKDQSSQVVANSLFEMARKWLEEKNTKVETIEVEVAELAWLGDGYPQYKLGQIVEVIDSVHMSGESGTTRLLPMYKLSCDLMSGSKKVTLGTPPKKELTQISASNSDSSTLSSTSSSGSSGGSGSGEECKVHDVRVDGTSVVSNKIANISLAGKADVSTVNALAATVANKADTSTVNALANVVSGKQDQIEFNTLEAATETLTRLKADNVVYNLGGGTEVVANPSETATDDLTTIKIGNTVYDIPGGGGGSGQDYECDLLFENTDGTLPGLSSALFATLSESISDYDALFIETSLYYNDDFHQAKPLIIFKQDYNFANSDGAQFVQDFSSGSSDYRLFIKLYDETHIYAYRTSNSGFGADAMTVAKVYGLKFKSSIDIFSPQIYSEEERIVGVWIDGKPLYQKTITIPISTTVTAYAHGISNVDNIFFDDSATYINTNGEIAHFYIGGYDDSGSYVSGFNRIIQSVDSTKITIKAQSNVISNLKVVVTLKYTKTTDQPGSSHWLSGGVMAVNYTEEEQIIGQYLGKTLYQKVITGNFNGAYSGNTQIPYNNISNNIEHIIMLDGYSRYSDNNTSSSSTWFKANYAGENIVNFRINDNAGAGYLQLELNNQSFIKMYDYYVIVQYTKTTDTAGNPMANILATQKELEEIAYHYRDHCYTTLSDYYSTEERVVGRWVDGKPLYQKSMEYNNVSTQILVIDVSSLNIERLCNSILSSGINAQGFNENAGGGYFLMNSDYLNVYRNTQNGHSEIHIRRGSDWSKSANGILTIQYTKTTDTPGTGPTPGNLVYLPALYSEEEREVGVWIDGKPLYQKTFLFEGPYTNQITNLPISLDNPEHAFILEAHCLNQNNAIITLPYVNHQTEANVGVFLSATMDSIGLRIANITTCKSIRATIQYTKTTDTAGSGKYLPDGQYAHHYYTSEKVVGTWIDGSTIYERTWDFGSSPISIAYNSWTSIGITISNFGKLVHKQMLGGTDGEIDISGAGIELKVNPDGTVYAEYNLDTNRRVLKILTLQYTKST